MRVAVISDIHANLRALEAVLAAIDAEHADTIWCLGDVVGYGPRPNECCAVVDARTTLCLAGNHDLVVRGDIDIEDFAGDAAEAARWTRSVLIPEASAFLARLEPQAQREGVELFHGSPRDPVWDYVLSEQVAWLSLRATTAPVLLVGHSHVALALRDEDGKGIGGGLAPAGTDLELAGRWLLNPGSVGQPRDGDPHAAWLLLDLTGRHASFRRVEYDVAGTQREMKEAGLPKALARRLARGE
ncbi:MAG: metallophosphoesterase family protein [Actinobacteria bacterium]|nr:MAG: metallophosphoesterase family protein [Actinomycetota bacterium]